jgi:maltose alpha-D-glucosyltransferase/alpha-amylase
MHHRFCSLLACASALFAGTAFAENPIQLARHEAAAHNSFPDLAKVSEAPKPAGPEWMHNAVFYQIYPQSFYDSNGDGIGDLKGITAKLDYVKSLGVDAIWINPFFESPFRDAGYDVSDYYKIAPRYGTNEDAKELFRVAHEKGLKILFDFVTSYTSIDHPWFKDSAEEEPNKHSNWYIWTDDTWFEGQENYTALFIQGYSKRNGNYRQNFFWSQPALNYGYGEIDPQQKSWQLPPDHPDVMALKEEMRNVLRFWMDMGADGFRADMAGTIVKNDPEQKYSREFWRSIRDIMDKEYPESFCVAEWESYRAALGGFHSNFIHWRREFYDLWYKGKDGYFMPEGKGDITKFLGLYEYERNMSLGKNYISLTVGNHDLPRINREGRDKTGIELVQMFCFTMPNVPFIYYGDEIGMKQLPIINGKEGCYGGRAGGRTPMQWTHGFNKGFSSGAPDSLWMPVDSAADAPNVADEETDPDSLLHFTRELVQFRKAHPALAANGGFYPVYAQPNKYPFAFIRVGGGEKLLVIINPSATEATAEINGTLKASRKLIKGTEVKWTEASGKTSITIGSESYAIYSLE